MLDGEYRRSQYEIAGTQEQTRIETLVPRLTIFASTGGGGGKPRPAKPGNTERLNNWKRPFFESSTDDVCEGLNQ